MIRSYVETPIFALVAFLFLTACQAYRSTPESEISYQRDELTRKGFVLAPLSVPNAKLNPGVSELTAYDTILANTLRARWPDTKMISSRDLLEVLGAEEIESWRKSLDTEEVKLASPSSKAVLKKFAGMGRIHPSQVLLPTLLQNTVSCGEKEALPSTMSSRPHGPRDYCQRTVKMRFRIMTIDGKDLLWNGLIYATQEAFVEKGASEKTKVEPPSTQLLIRDCFHNFAKQFSERGTS